MLFVVIFWCACIKTVIAINFFKGIFMGGGGGRVPVLMGGQSHVQSQHDGERGGGGGGGAGGGREVEQDRDGARGDVGERVGEEGRYRRKIWRRKKWRRR